jgi:hypothetical protein
MATSRAWTGGGNNQANNPADWLPRGAPQPGDDLSMTQGVINVSHNALVGDTLAITGSAGNEVDINTRAHARLDLSTIGHDPVSVHVEGTLQLTAQVDGFFGEQVNFTGGTIRFIGTSTFAGSVTVFDDKLVGSGTIAVNHASNGQGGSELLEVKGSVGRGLTFAIEAGGPPASLQIDDPARFHGMIDLPGPSSLVGYVAFMGLHAPPSGSA